MLPDVVILGHQQRGGSGIRRAGHPLLPAVRVQGQERGGAAGASRGEGRLQGHCTHRRHSSSGTPRIRHQEQVSPFCFFNFFVQISTSLPEYEFQGCKRVKCFPCLWLRSGRRHHPGSPCRSTSLLRISRVWTWDRWTR